MISNQILRSRVEKIFQRPHIILIFEILDKKVDFDFFDFLQRRIDASVALQNSLSVTVSLTEQEKVRNLQN